MGFKSPAAQRYDYDPKDPSAAWKPNPQPIEDHADGGWNRSATDWRKNKRKERANKWSKGEKYKKTQAAPSDQYWKR